MKLNYSEFCYSEIITADDVKLKENSLQSIEVANRLFEEILRRNGTTQVIKSLLLEYGEYEETEQCEQCGNWDTIVNLEI